MLWGIWSANAGEVWLPIHIGPKAPYTHAKCQGTSGSSKKPSDILPVGMPPCPTEVGQMEKQQPIHSQSALSANGGERWSECAGWEGGIPVSEHNSSAGEIAILTSQS